MYEFCFQRRPTKFSETLKPIHPIEFFHAKVLYLWILINFLYNRLYKYSGIVGHYDASLPKHAPQLFR